MDSVQIPDDNGVDQLVEAPKMISVPEKELLEILNLNAAMKKDILKMVSLADQIFEPIVKLSKAFDAPKSGIPNPMAAISAIEGAIPLVGKLKPIVQDLSWYIEKYSPETIAKYSDNAKA